MRKVKVRARRADGADGLKLETERERLERQLREAAEMQAGLREEVALLRTKLTGVEEMACKVERLKHLEAEVRSRARMNWHDQRRS